ncbi:MAG TPA: NeuD/PglB/VioB family sugar acetyltransferase [Rhizomicrobium sp.]|nr:NeuD/PglB/VioB family sugar acetyltransferase [Rhizomicrobium sp.]
MTAPVLILGTSGFAVELHALLQSAGRSVLGFVGPSGETVLPAAHLGDDAALDRIDAQVEVLVAVGAAAVRRRLMEMILKKGRKPATFVSPGAYVADNAELSAGVIIYPNATVHAAARLGKGVLVNSNASVGHETRIGDYGTVGPGAAIGGRCEIGAEAYLGIGCSIIESLRIAHGAVVGAGAVVVRSIESAGTYVGVPARRIA